MSASDRDLRYPVRTTTKPANTAPATTTTTTTTFARSDNVSSKTQSNAQTHNASSRNDRVLSTFKDRLSGLKGTDVVTLALVHHAADTVTPLTQGMLRGLLKFPNVTRENIADILQWGGLPNGHQQTFDPETKTHNYHFATVIPADRNSEIRFPFGWLPRKNFCWNVIQLSKKNSPRSHGGFMKTRNLDMVLERLKSTISQNLLARVKVGKLILQMRKTDKNLHFNLVHYMLMHKTPPIMMYYPSDNKFIRKGRPRLGGYNTSAKRTKSDRSPDTDDDDCDDDDDDNDDDDNEDTEIEEDEEAGRPEGQQDPTNTIRMEPPVPSNLLSGVPPGNIQDFVEKFAQRLTEVFLTANDPVIIEVLQKLAKGQAIQASVVLKGIGYRSYVYTKGTLRFELSIRHHEEYDSFVFYLQNGEAQMKLDSERIFYTFCANYNVSAAVTEKEMRSCVAKLHNTMMLPVLNISLAEFKIKHDNISNVRKDVKIVAAETIDPEGKKTCLHTSESQCMLFSYTVETPLVV